MTEQITSNGTMHLDTLEIKGEFYQRKADLDYCKNLVDWKEFKDNKLYFTRHGEEGHWNFLEEDEFTNLTRKAKQLEYYIWKI